MRKPASPPQQTRTTTGSDTLSPLWLLLFRVANAHATPYRKKLYFYPLKNNLLQKYGRPDGFTLQRLTYYCNRCDGNGNGGNCWQCCGTGVYDISHIALMRYRLAGELYHSPKGRCYPVQTGGVPVWRVLNPDGQSRSLDIPEAEIRERIEGLVEHSGEVNRELADLAIVLLLLRWSSVKRSFALLQDVARGYSQQVFRPYERFKAAWRKLTADNTKDELPF